MTAATAAPPDTETVESYWRLSQQWQHEQRGNHGRWCECLPRADLRAVLNQRRPPIVIGDEPIESEVHPGLLIDEARIRGEEDPHAWVALNHAYVEAVRKHGPLINQWVLVGMPRGVPVGTAFSTSESPMVIGIHGDRLVTVVMPMANDCSAIGMGATTPASTGATP